MSERERPEDSPHFAFDLTPGEIAMFAKIERNQAVLNILTASLGAYRDTIVKERNEFVSELCRKYKIENPAKVTFDARARRFVSIFSPDLIALKIDRRPRDFEQAATRLTLSAIRELLAIYKAAYEASELQRT